MAERYEHLDLWQALGLDAVDFDAWRDRRTDADAWAQLIAAVRGDAAALCNDTNPPAGQLLIAAAAEAA